MAANAVSSTSGPTIQQAEQSVQNALESLRHGPLSTAVVGALPFLVPDGYRPVAHLEHAGLTHQAESSASTWSPETGEIVIRFERVHAVTAPLQPACGESAPRFQPVRLKGGISASDLLIEERRSSRF